MLLGDFICVIFQQLLVYGTVQNMLICSTLVAGDENAGSAKGK